MEMPAENTKNIIIFTILCVCITWPKTPQEKTNTGEIQINTKLAKYKGRIKNNCIYWL